LPFFTTIFAVISQLSAVCPLATPLIPQFDTDHGSDQRGQSNIFAPFDP